MNVYHAMPWGKQGTDLERAASAPRGYTSLFDTEPAGDVAKRRPDYDYHHYDPIKGDLVKKGMSGEGIRFPDHYKG